MKNKEPMVTIVDNYLNQEKFKEFQYLMMGQDFGWYYSDSIDFSYINDEDIILSPSEVDKNKFQFTHTFYFGQSFCSSQSSNLQPILELMIPLSLYRIKANLITKTPNIVENLFHVDITNLSEEILKQWTTSIFYVNTNNGYTKFEDGTQVESVANRMVTFPANMKHLGTSCTDEKTRVVINFNYFKSE